MTTLTATIVDSADPVLGGANFTYTIQITNIGVSDAENVVVTIALDSGLTWVSTTGSGWSLGQSGQQVTASLALLTAGAANPIVITVTAAAAQIADFSTTTQTTCDNATTVNDTEITENVPIDGPAGWRAPRSAAGFTALGLTAPKYIHGMQDASGNLLSLTATTLPLIPGFTSSPPTYQQSVAGWTRKAVRTIDSDSGNGFKAVNATGPDVSATSWASLVFVKLNSAAATNRNICGNHGVPGGDTQAAIVYVTAADGKLRNFCAGNAIPGTYVETGNNIAILTIYNRTAGTWTTYTNQEKIVGSYNATTTNGGWGIGSDIDFAAGPTFAADAHFMWSALWDGADAEMSETTVKALFDAMSIDRPWTAAFDGPNHVYVPTVTADFTYLGITAPYSTHGFQETSGDALDLIGTGFTLTAGSIMSRNTAITESGWARKCWAFTHNNGNSYARAGAGVGPNPASESVLWIGLVDIITTTNSTQRQVLQVGGSVAAVEMSAQANTDGAGLCTMRAKCILVTADGVVECKTPAVIGIVGIQYDRTNSVARVFTLNEIVTTTYSALVDDGNKGWGTNPTKSPAGMQVTWDIVYKGANAELTTNQIRTLLQTLRHTVVW